MKKLLFIITTLFLFAMPVGLWAMQDTPAPRMEITGVNASQLPQVIVTANIYDSLGQPVLGLTADQFTLQGELAGRARIVSVENVTDDNLAFAAILLIDTSSSMDGQPIEKAKEAARTFINTIGPNDPVSIITFDSSVRTVLDYTTDKAVLLDTIDSLPYGGKTALYRGALTAVQNATNSPMPRRAVIILSDGAEFGNLSNVERGAALEEARKRGVTVYTIGLGFGTDRTYLRELADGTNAEFYESPEPDQLVEIYRNLANLLRSQYVITLEVDGLSLDGTEYDLGLQATTPEGDVSASATLRAPIPVPIVTLPQLSGEISELTTIEANVAADDGVAQVNFSLDSGEPVADTEAPYTFDIDPLTLPPGSHNLTVTALDGNGDTASSTLNLTIAALPSTVVVVPELDGTEISSPQTITLAVTGQTPAQSASFSLDGGDPLLNSEAPFEYLIDPIQLAPGEHTLRINVLNAGGAITVVDQTFTVAQLPATFVIRGLENGQSLDVPAEVLVDILGSQTPVTGLTFSLNGEPVDNEGRAPGSLLIDPTNLAPGAATLTVTVSEESGQQTSQDVDFLIAALPAEVTVNGLTAGETLAEDRTVSLETRSQTPITQVTYLLDGQSVATPAEAPYNFDLDILAVTPGTHILSVEVVNQGGQRTVVDTPFIVSDGPSLTATASVPTSTPVPTETPRVSLTPSSTPTIDSEATTNAQATVTTEAMVLQMATQEQANAQATVDRQATLNAMEEDERATVDAQSTLDAQATANAQATLESQSTSDAQATVTADARATANAQATLNAQLTLDAQAAADLEATTNAQLTLDAQATADLEATTNAQATQAVMEMRRTQAAANLQATSEARATNNALATSFAQSTQNAQMTRDAQANQTATVDVQLTRAAELEEEAEATANARLTATANAQATLDAETAETEQPTEEVTEEPTETEAPTEVAQVVEATVTPTVGQEEDTPVPTVTPIGTLIPEVTETAPASSNIVPILIVCGALFIVLLVIFLVLRGRRSQSSNPPNSTRR